MFDSPLLPAGSFKISHVELSPSRQNPPPVTPTDISRSFVSPDSETAHRTRMDKLKTTAHAEAAAETGVDARAMARMSDPERAAAEESIGRLAGVKFAAALHRQAEKAAARGQTTGALLNIRL